MRTTVIPITISKGLDRTTERNSANHHLFTRLCVGSGELNHLFPLLLEDMTKMTINARDVSKNISLEERDMYWRRSEIYRHWLLEKIFKADSTDSISVMVFPIEEGRPNYRDGDIPYMLI